MHDNVPRDAPGTVDIGFSMSERYNASAILFDNLPSNADRVAITGPAGTRTYAQLCDDANRCGQGLLGCGLQPGDRVLLFLDDTPAYPSAFFGALRAGLVPLLINTMTPPDLLQFYLADSGSRVAVVDACFVDRFNEVARAGTNLHTVLVTEDQWASRHAAELEPADTHRDDMAFWMYSSGSTGRPKGIVHLHHDMAYTVASYATHVLRLQPGDVCLSVPKIYFAYGLGNSLSFPFAAGASSVLLPGQPKPAAIFDAIRQYRPTVFFGLPTLYTALAKAPEAASADLASLRLYISAAEILSEQVFGEWKTLSGADIVEGLGSSEVLHIYLSNYPQARKPGSAGRPVPGYEIKLLDVSGRPVADGEEGILWVRGDSNAPAYWNRPDRTSETMREDGWIYTGDRFVRDSDGFYFFQGRADDLIKISGQWVHPLEVELCLANHPSIRECAVLAVQLPDKRMTLKAFVVRNETGAADPGLTATLQQYVKRTLMPFKYPRFVEYLPELPRTGTGKIDRQALRQAGVPGAE